MWTFIIIVSGQILSNLGSSLTDFGLGVWIIQATGSPTQFALSILLTALPRIVLSPFLGALVDRWDRRKVMIICDTILAVRTLSILLILSFGTLTVWQIYLVNSAGSVFSAFHGLAWSASRVMLVPKKHLARVNGISQAFGSGVGMLSPALAGVLYVLVGLRGITIVDLASWAFAVVPLLFVAIPRPAERAPVAGNRSLAREIAEGWKHLRSMAGLFTLLIIYSVLGFFGITTDVLLAPYVLSFSGPEKYGIIASAVSLGSVAGGLLLGIVGASRRSIGIILGCELLISVFEIVQGAFPSYVILLSAVLVYYAAISFCDGTITALWQRKIRPDTQGRVFAFRDTINMSLMPLGIMGFSPLAEFWFQPNLQTGGAWADSLGRLIGTGPGRGIGFLFILSGLVDLVIVAIAISMKKVRRIEKEIPDSSG